MLSASIFKISEITDFAAEIAADFSHSESILGGRETRFTYDEQGRQLTRTLPLGFGDDGILGTSDDPLNPDDWTETFEYDALGRQSLHVSFEGVVTEFVFSEQDGRLTEQRFFDNLTQYNNGAVTPAETVSFTYDAFGRAIETEQSATGRVETMTYDAQGRLVQVANPEGILVYEYDPLGRKTVTKVFAATADPGLDDPERVTSYGYDQLGRLKTVTEDADVTQTGGEQETMYAYDLVGNLDATLLPNGVIEDYVYDEMNRLDLLRTFVDDGTVAGSFDAGDTLIAEYDYTVRDDGKRVALTETFETSGGTLTNEYTWEFDDLGRLVEEVIDSSDNARDVTTMYAYDLVGNRLEKTVDNGNDATIDETITGTFDANDRLLEEEKDTDNIAGAEETTAYSYDKTQQTGKLETKSDDSTVTTANTFDLQGRMASVTIENRNSSNVLQSRTVSTYDYDSSGIRIGVLTETDSNGDGTFETRTRIESLVDAMNFTGYQQTIRETEYDADTSGVTKVTDYTFGHDEISQTVTEYDEFGNPGTPTTLYFGHDGHGSVRVLFDATAAVVQLFVYDAYGLMHAIYNGAGTFVSADAKDVLTKLLFSGEKTDATTGLPRQSHELRR